MPWSDRRYTGVCQRMLSCVVSTPPMEAPAGYAVGRVRRCETPTFIIFSDLSPARRACRRGQRHRARARRRGAVSRSRFADANPRLQASILDATAAASYAPRWHTRRTPSSSTDRSSPPQGTRLSVAVDGEVCGLPYHGCPSEQHPNHHHRRRLKSAGRVKSAGRCRAGSSLAALV
jgi:hypothetical protein